MAGKGGRRRGAGRPRGTGNKELQAVRDALRENREAILRRAIKLAMAKKPNTVLLCKLLDKVCPSLHQQELRGLPAPVEVVRIVDNIK